MEGNTKLEKEKGYSKDAKSFSMTELLKLEEEYNKKKKKYDEKVSNLEQKIQKLEEELSQTKEKKQEILIQKDLTKEEKEQIKKEMEESTPANFESEEVKINPEIFLKNEIVKSVSGGFNFSDRMKAIINKVRGKTLLGIAILSIWADMGNTQASNDVNINPRDAKIKNIMTTISARQMLNGLSGKKIENIDIDTYEQLSSNAQLIYLYSVANIDSSFVIVDKPRAEMYVINKDKKLIGKFPILLGKTKGEQPNISDTNTETPGANTTTPAGIYKIGRDSISTDGIKTYKGKIFSIYNSNNLAIHITYPPEKEKRDKALNTLDIEDNRISWGCINIDEENFDKYLKNNISENATLFITPDNENFVLNPQTKKLEAKNGTELLAKTNSSKTSLEKKLI